MTKEEYAKNFSSSHAQNGASVTVPDNVQRLTEHTPCFFCGEARGICRHRKAW